MKRAVCKAAELAPGKGKLVEAGGEQVALFLVDGRVHAIDNVCPHRDGPLAFGDLQGCVVYCPLHAWPFDVTTGQCQEFPSAAVRTFAAGIEGDDVVVDLPERPEQDPAGPPAEEGWSEE